MLLIVFSLGLLNFFWGEKVTAGGGFGWDGVNYANMVRNLDIMLSDGQLSHYYAQRFLPSAMVRGLFLITGISMSDLHIIQVFELYNLVLLACTCWVWKRVADNFTLSLAGRWIGFSGIFINFECSKQAFFYPVLTDVTALFIAMLLLLYYVTKRPVALFFTTIIGAFCWPVVSVSGALLLIFLKTELSKDVVDSPSTALDTNVFRTFNYLKYGGLILVIALIGYLIIDQLVPVSDQACSVFSAQLQTLANALPSNISNALERMLHNSDTCILDKLLINRAQPFLTALPSLYVLLVALIMLVGSFAFFKETILNFRRTDISLVALSIAAVLIPALIVRSIENPGIANAGSVYNLIFGILFPPKGKFLLPFVTLALFWGPLVLLLVMYWKAFTRQARKLGPGVMAIVAISITLGLVNEPRFLTIGWPFLVLGIVLVLEESKTKPAFKYVLLVLTILYAQFWMRLNLSPWMPPDYEGLQDYPKQLYFMHYGLWMSWLSYLIQLPVLVFSAYWLNKLVHLTSNE